MGHRGKRHFGSVTGKSTGIPDKSEHPALSCSKLDWLQERSHVCGQKALPLLGV